MGLMTITIILISIWNKMYHEMSINHRDYGSNKKMRKRRKWTMNIISYWPKWKKLNMTKKRRKRKKKKKESVDSSEDSDDSDSDDTSSTSSDSDDSNSDSSDSTKSKKAKRRKMKSQTSAPNHNGAIGLVDDDDMKYPPIPFGDIDDTKKSKEINLDSMKTPIPEN